MSKSKASEKFPRKHIPALEGATKEESMRNVAKLATSPELAASRVVSATEGRNGIGEQLDVPALLEILRDHADAISSSDMAQAEAMLINQAVALQSLFSKLTEKAMGFEYIENFEKYMKLAMRAQNQCRQTIEALSAVKNPPVVYAKQANFAQGHQQVNNGVDSRAHESKIGQNEVSEVEYELLPDSRASETSSGVDPTLETLGKIDRSKVPRG